MESYSKKQAVITTFVVGVLVVFYQMVAGGADVTSAPSTERPTREQLTYVEMRNEYARANPAPSGKANANMFLENFGKIIIEVAANSPRVMEDISEGFDHMDGNPNGQNDFLEEVVNAAELEVPKVGIDYKGTLGDLSIKLGDEVSINKRKTETNER